jgi:hypothetical protein
LSKAAAGQLADRLQCRGAGNPLFVSQALQVALVLPAP